MDFEKWLDGYMPNRVHDTHAVFSYMDMKRAFSAGKESYARELEEIEQDDWEEEEKFLLDEWRREC